MIRPHLSDNGKCDRTDREGRRGEERGGEVESIRRRCENLRERRHDGDGESGLADIETRKRRRLATGGARREGKEGEFTR